MKNETKKIALAGLASLLLNSSCIKNPPGPIGNNPIDDVMSKNCTNSATGTIEVCDNNSNLWFINANNITKPYTGGFAPNPTRLMVANNLPAAYKINGLTVRFDFNWLKDSTAIKCGFCGTPPFPYAKNIELCSIKKDSNVIIAYKPVIYLYPEKETKVKVELNYKGNLTVTYPDFDKNINGWEVTAKKDGTLKNQKDNLEYQYLFWEGAPTVPYSFNMNEGYCVKGSDTKTFLQNTLPKLGLTAKEYNEMIVFWLPKMMNNNYNIIHFAGESYTKSAPLTITPKPQTLIRVFMAYRPSNTFVKTSEPLIHTPKRTGFTVVEWGGTEMSKPNDSNTHLF